MSNKLLDKIESLEYDTKYYLDEIKRLEEFVDDQVDIINDLENEVMYLRDE